MVRISTSTKSWKDPFSGSDNRKLPEQGAKTWSPEDEDSYSTKSILERSEFSPKAFFEGTFTGSREITQDIGLEPIQIGSYIPQPITAEEHQRASAGNNFIIHPNSKLADIMRSSGTPNEGVPIPDLSLSGVLGENIVTTGIDSTVSGVKSLATGDLGSIFSNPLFLIIFIMLMSRRN